MLLLINVTIMNVRKASCRNVFLRMYEKFSSASCQIYPDALATLIASQLVFISVLVSICNRLFVQSEQHMWIQLHRSILPNLLLRCCNLTGCTDSLRALMWSEWWCFFILFFLYSMHVGMKEDVGGCATVSSNIKQVFEVGRRKKHHFFFLFTFLKNSFSQSS